MQSDSLQEMCRQLLVRRLGGAMTFLTEFLNCQAHTHRYIRQTGRFDIDKKDDEMGNDQINKLIRV